jgi:hypothetical protein
MALLVVQLTLYKTLMHGLGRIGGVLAGVLVAVGVANVAGLTWWSLGAVVAGSLVIGRLLRLGPHLFEAPITAMLLLEVSAGGALALTRVTEALLGALVGITVSVLVAPPLYLQPAGEAIGELAERMANFARDFADGLRGPWSRSAADHWLTQARAVRDEVLRADLTVARVEESARLHPHARSARDAQPRLRSTLTGLERCHLTLRTLARAVLDRTYFMPLPSSPRRTPRPARRAGRPAHHRRGRDRQRHPHRHRHRPGRRPTLRRGPPRRARRPAPPDQHPAHASTPRPTRPPGNSTAHCWPPSTGSASRSPPPHANPMTHRTSTGRDCPCVGRSGQTTPDAILGNHLRDAALHRRRAAT